jgi:TPR repeat protein
MYELGHGKGRDPKRATKLYEKAARKGHLQAQTNLAVNYLEGIGVRQNMAEGFRWLRRAAGRGDDLAQYNLGRAYLEGDGVRKNETHAKNWLSKAAKGGHSKARRLLRSVQR